MDAEASVLILYTGGTLGMLRSDKVSLLSRTLSLPMAFLILRP